MVFRAGIHGINLNENSEGKPKEEAATGLPVFQSPEEYKQMPKEEKEALTKQMMGKHKLKFG